MICIYDGFCYCAAYRNWMNSMGVQPYVNYLYGDLADGLIIFQVITIPKFFVDLITLCVLKFDRLHPSPFSCMTSLNLASWIGIKLEKHSTSSLLSWRS